MKGNVFVAALAAASLSASLLTSSGSAAKPALPFIEDDYPRALAEARARKLPIFVETWAPW